MVRMRRIEGCCNGHVLGVLLVVAGWCGCVRYTDLVTITYEVCYELWPCGVGWMC